ncbi:MAG: hypothetical protein ABJA78_07410 [Ferruginibacter sp.]
MKIMTLIFCLLFSMACIAQEVTAAEIKKLHIKKITVTTRNKESVTRRIETWYDANGYDTAVYNGKNRVTYKKITYNKKNKQEKVEQYDNESKLIGTTVFSYKLDGTYTAVFTDAVAGMKNTYSYDQMGRQISFAIPDGSVIKYTYNAKGQLISAHSVSSENGLKMNSTYTYNAKGKLVSLKTTGDYPIDVEYEYGPDGLLKKEKAEQVNTYQYSY